MSIQETEFPCYYVDSNIASKRAQNAYKRITLSTLALMFISTILVSLPASQIHNIPYFETINGWILFSSCLISLYLNYKSPEKNWYLGRAIAESIKTLSWRYMMHAEPFQGSDEKADLNIFTERMLSINKQANAGKFIPKPNKIHLDIITKRMSEIRKLDFAERKTFYSKNRIEDQINWYGKKSRFNRNWARACSYFIVVCQGFAAIYMFEFIDKIKFINMNNILVFMATTTISVIELNKYKELHESYALTKLELNIVRTKFRSVENDAELNEFVLEAEQAISREHTMWLARRVNSDYGKE